MQESHRRRCCLIVLYCAFFIQGPQRLFGAPATASDLDEAFGK
jgi:hypothetical protein